MPGLSAGALERAKKFPPPDLDGDPVRFHVGVSGDRISLVTFRAHRCVSLLACCEALARTIVDRTIAEALAITPADLIDAVVGMPANKANSAKPPVAALHRALVDVVAANHRADSSPNDPDHETKRDPE